MQEPKTIIKDKSNYFKPEQIERMLTKAPSDIIWLLVFLLYRTGRRVSELLLLKPSDVDYDSNLIRWTILKKRVKTKKWKAQDNNTIDWLKYYIKGHKIREDQYIFESSRKNKKGELSHFTRKWAFTQVRDLARRCRIIYKEGKRIKKYVRDFDTLIESVPGWHPHHFRHSFSINFLKKADTASALTMLKQHLEHSSIDMTQHYLEFSQKDQVAMLNKVFKK